MDLDIARQWTAALRGGEYPQGKNALNDSGEFCCFGVLCDMFVKENPNVVTVKISDVGTISYDDNYLLPPQRILGWAGLGSEYGTIDLNHLTDPRADADREEPVGLELGLSALNDDGLTFDQIADLIDNFAQWL